MNSWRTPHECYRCILLMFELSQPACCCQSLCACHVHTLVLYILLCFTNVSPFHSLLYKLYSCNPWGRWLRWKRSAFRGLLSTASAMLIWGYLTWASPSASICLHLSHSVWASQCLCLCQQPLIICSHCNKCSGTLLVRYSFDKHTVPYVHMHIQVHRLMLKTHRYTVAYTKTPEH